MERRKTAFTVTYSQTIVTLFLLINSTAQFITFALFAKPHTKSCLREFFPENESVAIHYTVHEGNVEARASKNTTAPTHKYIHHYFYNNKGKELGAIKSKEEDVFTYVTTENEIIAICVDNFASVPVLVEYNITMNIYNNDHSGVPDKNHLRLYDEDLTLLEELTDQMLSENKLVKQRSNQRFINSKRVSNTADKLAAFAVFFIFLIKIAEIVILKSKLRQKKIL